MGEQATTQNLSTTTQARDRSTSSNAIVSLIEGRAWASSTRFSGGWD
jgi:hypothetical protein